MQEVYRLQGVKINDKHIGVIVRQMLQKVRITESGDTEYLEGETIDRLQFLDANQVADSGRARRRDAPSRCCSASRRPVAHDAELHLRGELPGDHAGADRCSHSRRRATTCIGLKENIIIGHLIPAGTGIYRYSDVDFATEQAAEPVAPAVRRQPVPV